MEACESGSIFEGIMPKDINVYVTTASNAQELSFGTYCPGMDPPPPPEYLTCLGDLFSVSWMEDAESHNLKAETLEQQHQSVRIFLHFSLLVNIISCALPNQTSTKTNTPPSPKYKT